MGYIFFERVLKYLGIDENKGATIESRGEEFETKG